MSRYLRRLAVVCAVIAAVVGLGFLWRVSPAAGLVADGGGPRRELPAGASQPRDGDRHHLRLDGGLDLNSIDDLGQTVFIGVGVLGVVVAVDRARRRRRPVVPRTSGGSGS